MFAIILSLVYNNLHVRVLTYSLNIIYKLERGVCCMVYVYKKNERESADGMIKRFTRRVQQSGVLMGVRRNRFNTKGKNRGARREEAIYKSRIRTKIDRLKKIGHFDDDALKELKRKMRQDR